MSKRANPPSQPDLLEQLQTDIHNCKACPRLVAWREQVAVEKRASYRDETYWGRPISGFGDPEAQVVVLGLAPAAHGANRTGRVFTGDRSGDWLYRAMHKAGFANQANSTDLHDGLTLANAWVTAAVRCAPPDNKPMPDERDRCIPFLQREIVLLRNTKVVITLGKFAYDVALKGFSPSTKPKFGHGVEASATTAHGKPLTIICSFHPSQQNTFTGKLTEPMIDAIFSRAQALASPAPR
jgi:uracil-DNA glycosylase